MSIKEEISEKMRNRTELSTDKEFRTSAGMGAAKYTPMSWEEKKVLIYSRLSYVEYLCCDPLSSHWKKVKGCETIKLTDVEKGNKKINLKKSIKEREAKQDE